jgi:hypothetical protein
MYKTRSFDDSNPQLTYEIAKPKVWDASALRPNRQSNNHLNGARMASKAQQSQNPSGMDHMECHHQQQTQEGGAKFT